RTTAKTGNDSTRRARPRRLRLPTRPHRHALPSERPRRMLLRIVFEARLAANRLTPTVLPVVAAVLSAGAATLAAGCGSSNDVASGGSTTAAPDVLVDLYLGGAWVGWVAR